MGIRIGNLDWGLGLGFGIGIWGRMVLVYRLKIVFALDGYLIGCGDSGLVSSQHNLAFFFDYFSLYHYNLLSCKR